MMLFVVVIVWFMLWFDVRLVLCVFLDVMIILIWVEDGCCSYDFYESVDGGELVFFEWYCSCIVFDEYCGLLYYLNYWV